MHVGALLLHIRRPFTGLPHRQKCKICRCSHFLRVLVFVYLPCGAVTLCADELIRQVTINCAERGLLLLRVRDEIRITIAAYQTLYESSVAFGMRKALASEQGKSDLEKKV